MRRWASRSALQGEPAKSVLFVPLIVGGEVAAAVISLQNLDHSDAFSELGRPPPDDARLEPQRRPRERPPVRRDEAPPRRDRPAGRRAGDHQRASRRASPAELDMQAMYDARRREDRESIFDAQVGRHRDLRRRGRHDHLRVLDRAWCPLPVNDLRDRRIRPDRAARPARCSSSTMSRPGSRRTAAGTRRLSGEPAKSVLFAPLIVGGRGPRADLAPEPGPDERVLRLAMSGCSRRSRAASASPSRTPACSTRRNGSCAETDQRAAELAIINGVQEGLAAQTRQQAMYELVGDKIHEIFDAQVVDIAVFDREAESGPFAYSIERGVRFDADPDAARRLPPARSSRRASPILINRRLPGAGQPGDGTRRSIVGEPPRSALFAPLAVGSQVERRHLAPEP